MRCEEDPALVAELAARRMPLTVCPLSNVKLRVYETMAEHNLARLLAAGLCVTVSSDDPAYFGGYVGANYRAIADALPLGEAELVQLARNAVEGSWLHADRKATLYAAIADAAAGKA